jgi:lipoprotein-anchoring transpeptidase ErfK/SrfK
MYDAMPEERFPIPAVKIEEVDQRFWRTVVDNRTGEPAGTLVVDTPSKYLYFTGPDGSAVRYGIGVGREGFAWSGRAKVAYKREWPRWTPPDEMVARQPELEPFSIANGGMNPGLRNPLGARALYIFKDDVDTLYRLHGTHEESSIGRAVSSGCIRLLNQDVIDLYQRVPNGTPIKVVPDANPGTAI